ncbi:hypothetical protein TRIUR3_27209 [Triticum urartu]|uniref:Uncharacterized protein n=1 Tax=Triticum urartu TaxID=4572 RepID=M8A379_TRIUA|nr:hypothetical protein TRIUR3_27209 [Triticum urartu]
MARPCDGSGPFAPQAVGPKTSPSSPHPPTHCPAAHHHGNGVGVAETQINAQLTDSYNGLTIFAPTDAAFDGLKAGTFNTLSSQEQIQMVLYCVLPRFYSLSMLGTLNGKVSTQASGHSGPYTYKIKPSGNNVNVSTGVKGNNMLLGSVSKPKKKKKSAGIAEAPEADDATADDDTEKSAAASLSGVARWAAVLGAAVLGAMF